MKRQVRLLYIFQLIGKYWFRQKILLWAFLGMFALINLLMYNKVNWLIITNMYLSLYVILWLFYISDREANFKLFYQMYSISAFEVHLCKVLLMGGINLLSFTPLYFIYIQNLDLDVGFVDMLTLQLISYFGFAYIGNLPSLKSTVLLFIALNIVVSLLLTSAYLPIKLAALVIMVILLIKKIRDQYASYI